MRVTNDPARKEPSLAPQPALARTPASRASAFASSSCGTATFCGTEPEAGRFTQRTLHHGALDQGQQSFTQIPPTGQGAFPFHGANRRRAGAGLGWPTRSLSVWATQYLVEVCLLLLLQQFARGATVTVPPGASRCAVVTALHAIYRRTTGL